MASQNDLNGLIKIRQPSLAIKAIINRRKQEKDKCNSTQSIHIRPRGQKRLLIQAGVGQQPGEQRVVLLSMGNDGLFGLGQRVMVFKLFLFRNKPSISAILVSKMYSFQHSGLGLGMAFRRSYFFIIFDKTSSQSCSQLSLTSL